MRKPKPVRQLGLLISIGVLVLGLMACQRQAAPTAQPTPTEQAKPAFLYVFSDKSPHVAVIDAATNKAARTADIPGLKQWASFDDNNYFDGTNLWMGTRDPDTLDLHVIALNLETLSVTSRHLVGNANNTFYIGKATKDGSLLVGMRDLGTVVSIDTRGHKINNTWNVPVLLEPQTGKPLLKSEAPQGSAAGVVCDADVTTGPDGIERFYYPTLQSELVISMNPKTAEILKVVQSPTGSRANMLTAAPDGTVWVQEPGTNSNAIHHPVTLDLIARFPTGRSPLVATFSPDGKLGYITGGDTAMTVADAQSYRVLRNVEVGANATQAAVHPNGKVVYVQVSMENAVAVVDTATWQVTERIDLGVSPAGIFFRPL